MRLAQFYLALRFLKDEYTDSNLPLHRALKSWFQNHRNMGSSDRKVLTTAAYAFFRTFYLTRSLSLEDRLLAAFFILDLYTDFVAQVKPEWAAWKEAITADASSGDNLNAKIKFLELQFPNCVFKLDLPFEDALSPQIDRYAFKQSFLKQPSVFVRVKKSALNLVRPALPSPFEEFPFCFRVGEGKTLEDLQAKMPGAFEIQDYSVQQVGALLTADDGSSWWDPFAGSGGKTLLLAEQAKDLKIYASDIRPSMMPVLKSRLANAGTQPVRAFTADIDQGIGLPEGIGFDGIVADVPCTGSGTWARSPEQTAWFQESTIAEHAKQQLKMVKNLLPFLKPGGVLIYITCSAFAEENERVVEQLLTLELAAEKINYYKGYAHGADTIFAARLVKCK